jgi:ectoine hydroxylase-related dioxygenase (phytanoyl-CoA dioxygenase family)
MLDTVNQLNPNCAHRFNKKHSEQYEAESKRQYKDQYNDQGYFVVRDYFTPAEMVSLRDVILTFHEAWKLDNLAFYQEIAFNSSLITGSQYLSEDNRLKLFNFISSAKIMALVNAVIPTTPAFMNTQLFFNPYNDELKDFWHRDCQYDHDIETQKKVIQETQVMHLRVPLFDELGMELVPETHRRWDTQEEFDVRNEENGRLSNESLPNGKQIRLSAGDVLVFSADMIHRGLYGMDRLAFDILVFDPKSDFADYVDDDCLPTPSLLEKIENPNLFLTTINLK